ncbi:MAG: DUF1176 domain-containing protein [Hyphomicrobiales bacterium]|nr:DUF1176 domain-containing protein [Hyphomicrobiales bacterium]
MTGAASISRRATTLAIAAMAAGAVVTTALGAAEGGRRGDLAELLSARPRIAARGEGLVAAMTAATERLGRRDAAAIENVDHLADPKRLAGWEEALEAPGMRAALEHAPWEWFAMAEIAIEMGDGHLGAKGKLVRPDLFAREAFYDIAAGAAWNGLLATDDADQSVTGLAILAHALEVGGDVDGAARVAALAERRYGDPQTRSFDHDISFLLRHTGAKRRPFVAAVSAGYPVARRIAGWAVDCDALRACVVATEAAGGRVEIRRAAGPAAPVGIAIVLPASAEGTTAASPRPAIDGKPLPGTGDGLVRIVATDGARRWETPPLRLAATLDAMLAGRTLTIANADGARAAVLPLADLRAAATIVDEVQGRGGTATALVKRGGRPAGQVPPPPLATASRAPTSGAGTTP